MIKYLTYSTYANDNTDMHLVSILQCFLFTGGKPRPRLRSHASLHHFNLINYLAKRSPSLPVFGMDEDMGNCMVKGIAQAQKGRLKHNPDYPFSS